MKNPSTLQKRSGKSSKELRNQLGKNVRVPGTTPAGHLKIIHALKRLRQQLSAKQDNILGKVRIGGAIM